jgi:hypothetical protein
MDISTAPNISTLKKCRQYSFAFTQRIWKTLYAK